MLPKDALAKIQFSPLEDASWVGCPALDLRSGLSAREFWRRIQRRRRPKAWGKRKRHWRRELKIWSFTTWELFQDLPPNIRGSGSFNPYCLLLSLLRDTAVMKKGSVASTRCFKLKYAKNTKIRGNEYIQGPCAQAAR